MSGMGDYENLLYKVAKHIGLDADTDEGYTSAEYVMLSEGMWDDEGDDTWREARRRFFATPYREYLS